ncbi:conjugal transfer protein MobB [Porphyromonas gingivalis]|uniref:conjugal transfer protein MobB n=1 Tax=Porphyromonas gingivalis TaxID=837 RepID=UPI0024DFAD49|nr:conjugal transfer protein MobB [Porphyromonas gingivalis]WIM92346.1 conjugal transfer protein MobB [Porphyromonas gingivalis]
MIAKISGTANLGGALGYNFKKVEAKEATILLAHGLYQNTNGKYTMSEVLADMQALIPQKCRTKNVVFHCSLNPHPDEKLSDDILARIAQEYMQALGYGKQPYIIFKHNDIAREHIHIVSLRIDGKGCKLNDQFEKRRSKKITDALEHKYGLLPSTTQRKNQIEKLQGVEQGKGRNIREQIASVARSVISHYHFCSLGEFNAILTKYKLAVEEVKTEYRGKRYNGLIYVPTDGKGSKIGTPIHASEIGRGVGYSAVQHKIQQSKQNIKPLVANIRQRVLQVMRTSPRTEEELHRRLEDEGLRAVIRKNNNGRIYGITFIDDKSGAALNGSRLGKGYGANQFEAYFSDLTHNHFLNEELYGQTAPSEQVNKQLTQNLLIQEKAGDNLIDEVLEELVGDTSLPIGNDDWKESAWQRKLRRQNKIRLKRRKR